MQERHEQHISYLRPSALNFQASADVPAPIQLRWTGEFVNCKRSRAARAGPGHPGTLPGSTSPTAQRSGDHVAIYCVLHGEIAYFRRCPRWNKPRVEQEEHTTVGVFVVLQRVGDPAVTTLRRYEVNQLARSSRMFWQSCVVPKSCGPVGQNGLSKDLAISVKTYLYSNF